MTYFESNIKEIGAAAVEFAAEKMMILFDEQRFVITAVGTKANSTFRELGHMTIKFNGQTTADLPGTIHVEEKEYPQVTIGSTIRLEE